MARSKATAPPANVAPSSDDLRRLTEQVDALGQRIDTLTARTDALNAYIEELTLAIDHFREDYGVLLDRRRGGDRPVMHITSMPKDPCAPDFGERVNRYSAKDLSPEEAPAAASVEPRGLFD